MSLSVRVRHNIFIAMGYNLTHSTSKSEYYEGLFLLLEMMLGLLMMAITLVIT